MAGQGRPSRQSAPEQAERQAWRVLVMVLKAKLEAVEAGITTITGFLGDTDYSPQQELTEDILAILHTFSCRLHGLRRYRNAIQADTGLSDSSAATDAETLF